MRKLKHISYSGFTLFESQPEQFYRRYLAEDRGPRDPQNHYMAVGSAFDAFAKADLHKKFVNDGDPKFELRTLFETQVEEHQRTQAWLDGKDVFDWYVKVGAYDSLVREMEGCVNPQFESDLSAELTHPTIEGGIILFGKPDVAYVNRMGCRVVHDFKVNGYYSAKPPSPRAGYLEFLPGRKMHAKCTPREHKGHRINGATFFSSNYKDWAEQLTIYAWSLGAPIGSDYVLSVDQLCCNKDERTIQVAKHAGICSDTWQKDLFRRIHRCWTACLNGHIFLDIPYEDSQARQALIDLELATEKTPEFIAMTSRER